MDFKIRDKVALITGGTHGIGLSTALALADQGCKIAVCSRSETRVAQALESLRSRGASAIGVVADVMNPADIDRVMKAVIEAYGTIHILVNNVGGGGRWGKAIIEDTPEETWMEVYQKNAGAAIRFTRQAIPFMLNQKWGRVVTVTSIYGREGGGRPWFNMAKAAEMSMMKSMAMDPRLSRGGITFNSVAPGSIMIPGTGWEEERRKNPEAFDQKISDTYPLGRLGLPEEVASVIAFVCSEGASLLNGSCIPVDGAESRSF